MIGKVLIVLLCAVNAVAHQSLGWCGAGLAFVWLIARDMRAQPESER